MRHKYETRGIVLSRTPVGEANVVVAILTSELGLLYARAQGLRETRAKLAHALPTFAESDVVLVRGKDGWRLSGAVLVDNWFTALGSRAARARAARVTTLVLRLSPGEVHEESLFETVHGFLHTLAHSEPGSHDAAEVLAALRVLAALGLDAGALPSGALFAEEALQTVEKERAHYVSRVNRGIAASGL